MAQEPRIPELRRSIGERIESVAAQFVAGGPATRAEAAETLRRIRQESEQAGWDEVARLAGRMSGRVESSPDWTADRALAEGLEKLRRALEKAAPEPDAAAAPAAKSANSLAQDPGLVNDFLLETREHLVSIENDLLTLDRGPAQPEALHSLFRSFHTVKGLAGFLEFENIRDLTHEVETILDLARNGRLSMTPAIIDVVLESADFLKQEMDRLEAGLGGAPAGPPGDPGPLIARVRAAGGAPAAGEAQPAEGEETAVERRQVRGAQPSPAPPGDAPGASAAPAREAKAPAAPEKFSVRVDTAKLDYLLDMVGEMVIAQSMVRQDPDLGTLRNPRVTRNLTQLARVTDEVQKTAMAMRMMPVGQLFHRIARLVRDMSRKMGKRVELVLSGEETQIDKTIVEELADPMMHMVRNALDHGIENPAEREASGKDPQARLHLSASHQAGHILIEIRDDGRGLNTEKILAKARERGLVSEGAQMSDNDVFNLIFEPGFSTAEKLTDVSGRGVGMDVVKKQVTKLRGRIEIRSERGKGTAFLLKLPLTLAIIDGLVVGVGGERYIVPIFTVQEMFRPKPEMVSTVHGRNEMVTVRGRLLPIVRLHQRFGVRPRTLDACESLLIVAEAAGRRFCLLVDEFIGKQEVVIKSLGETMKNLPGIAGGAILGDGRVGLILDLEGVCGEAARG
jgi:two-component system chemotaxis sensor kinase CheA